MRGDLGGLTSSKSIESFRLSSRNRPCPSWRRTVFAFTRILPRSSGSPTTTSPSLLGLSLRHRRAGSGGQPEAGSRQAPCVGCDRLRVLGRGRDPRRASRISPNGRWRHLPPARRLVLQPRGHTRLRQRQQCRLLAEHPGHRAPPGRTGCLRRRNAAGHHRHAVGRECRRTLLRRHRSNAWPGSAAAAGTPPESLHSSQAADSTGRAAGHRRRPRRVLAPRNWRGVYCLGRPRRPGARPTENPPTDWDFPAVVLDKLIPLTPFWQGVCDDLKRGEIMMSAGQYVYTPDDQPLIGPAAGSARLLSELWLLGWGDACGRSRPALSRPGHG